ncbi:OmpA family protein [Rosenbergiella metrosideri]|uniref:OmpA family protein n=1 Tax=Rosenbergiella metrosideri TaxID=2921185 RepID=UPI001F4FA8CD|nr:OmpA family protein [Rosenbergiella metrosideri]
MRRIWLRFSLFVITSAFLLCFALSLLPALQKEWLVMPVMILLALILVSLHGYSILAKPPNTDTPPLLPRLAAVEKPVMLIVGPYAAKWFRQYGNGDDSRFNHTLVWLLANDAKTLALRLKKIGQVSPKARAVVFFPLLPDAEDSAEQIKIKISQWEQEFTTVLTHYSLPAVLAVYARLSRVGCESQHVTETWLGNLAIDPQQALSPEKALSQLSAQIDSTPPATPQDVQRAVLGKQLFAWLTKSGITQCLTRIFFPTSLRLNQLLLCDCSSGFHRHGAWSSWLAQRYGLLPALSTRTAEPSLPMIELKSAPSYQRERPRVEKRVNALRWSQLLVTIILAASLLITTLSIHRQQQAFRLKIQHILEPLDNLSAVRLQRRIAQLQALYTGWSPCTEVPEIRLWGLSPCAKSLTAINQRIALLSTLPIYSTPQWHDHLFDSGSSTLLPQASRQLAPIIELIRSHPQQKIVITGHADNSGSKRVNDIIAARRAEAVAQWLTEHGIDPSLLITQSAGADEPIAPNDNVQGRQENRRVDVIILPSAEIAKEFTTL